MRLSAAASIGDRARTFLVEDLGQPSILIHGINFAPELIGVAQYTSQIVEYLLTEGHSVEVITAPPHYPGWHLRPPFRNRYSVEKSDRLKVYRCPLFLKRNGRGLWRLLSPLTFAISSSPVVIWRVLRSRPQIVLAIEPTLFSSPAALLAAKIVGARVVLHVQDLEVDAAFEVGYVKGGVLRKLAVAIESQLLRGFSQLVTVSGKMRDRLIEKGVRSEKVAVIRNWVVNLIKPRPRADNPYRRELGIQESEFVVLYAGHLGLKQGLLVLMDALDLLVGAEGITWVIAGEGPIEKDLMKRAEGRSFVKFLPLQPADRLGDLLGLADLHVLPQQRGVADLVLPSKLGGMLASGRPIVATVDANTELYSLLANIALIVPAGDAAALSAAILQAKETDFSDRVRVGLELAQTLQPLRSLPKFRSLLLGEYFQAGSGEVTPPAALLSAQSLEEITQQHRSGT